VYIAFHCLEPPASGCKSAIRALLRFPEAGTTYENLGAAGSTSIGFREICHAYPSYIVGRSHRISKMLCQIIGFPRPR
jgi:hypothetical protein